MFSSPGRMIAVDRANRAQSKSTKSNPYLDEELINNIRKNTGDSVTNHSLNADHSLQSLGGLDENHENDEILDIHKSHSTPSGVLQHHMSSPKKFLDCHEPITLNVGGIKYQTTLTTLGKYKDCLLYKMFEGLFSKKPNKDGSYFIDRNGKYFEYILDFIRNGKLNIPINNNNSYLINHLLFESDYYQIVPLIKELTFLKIGTKLLNKKNISKIEKWIIEEFPDRKHLLFQWKLLYKWNCDDITLKNPYNVMHAKCEGINSILIVLLCGNRVFGAYTSVKWKAKDVNDNDSFVYWFGKEVIANNIYTEKAYGDNDESIQSSVEMKHNDEYSYNNNKKKQKTPKKKDNGDRKYKFNYDSYREFKSYDSNSENHRCMKFCGGYNDVVVCRYKAGQGQYGHFSIYTNETGYTVTASGPLSLDNSMHLQRMEIFHI